MAETITRRQVEGTIATLRKNLAQAISWYGEDSNQAGNIRRILGRSEDKLRTLTKETA